MGLSSVDRFPQHDIDLAVRQTHRIRARYLYFRPSISSTSCLQGNEASSPIELTLSSLTLSSDPFFYFNNFQYFLFPDDVKFSELSKDIQITAGGSVFLHCVTSSAVEQCRWSLTPVNSNTTVVVKQFPAAGSEARDCSVRLTHALAEQEGLWTCGARIRGRQNYTDAPPAKLSLLEPGIIESWDGFTAFLSFHGWGCRESKSFIDSTDLWSTYSLRDTRSNFEAWSSIGHRSKTVYSMSVHYVYIY